MTPALADRRLYLCTADRPDLQSFLRDCIEGGVDVVQLRDKDLDARSVLARAALVRPVCTEYGVPFILNDRPDLALAAEADGGHLGQDDAPASVARRILGPDALIGLSTHGDDDFDHALGQDADDLSYLSAGPVVPTPTKPGRPGTGPEYPGSATRRSPLPVFVTGGVTPATVGALVDSGCRRFVVVRWLTESDKPGEAARELRCAIDAALGVGS